MYNVIWNNKHSYINEQFKAIIHSLLLLQGAPGQAGYDGEVGAPVSRTVHDEGDDDNDDDDDVNDNRRCFF